MASANIVVNITPHVRRRWLLRLGAWLMSRAYIEVMTDGGKPLGRAPISVQLDAKEDD